MESEGSLTCSQEPITGPYPEPHDSSPNLPNLFKSIMNSYMHVCSRIIYKLFSGTKHM